MTAPHRTTFEVTVSNRLKYNAAYIQIQAELQYATELSLSSNNKNSHKAHQEFTQSDTQSNAFTDSESKSDSNKTQNKLSSRKSIKLAHSESDAISQSQAEANAHEESIANSHSQSSANSQKTDVSASGSGWGVSVSASVSHANSNEQSSSGSNSKSSAGSNSKSSAGSKSQSLAVSNSKSGAQSTDELKDNSASLSNSKQRAKSSTVSRSNKSSNEYDKSKSLSSSSKLENIKITPGFVRIACGQSLSIPVIVENESQVVYITVYIQDHKSGESFCIANALQINRQHIEIKNDKNNDIILQPAERKQSYDFRQLLTAWGLPAFIQDAMELSGWDDTGLWHEITERDLIKMGFKTGHVVKFNNKFTQWKTNNDIQHDCVDYKILLKEWKMPINLFDSMKKAGWDDIELWDQIDEKDFKEMEFSRGHEVKFKRYIENNKHLKLFEELKTKKDLYEYNHANNTNSESKYDRPDPPKFTINPNEIYHTSFHLNLEDFNHNHMYIVEINKNKNAIHNWKPIDKINKKRHQIKKVLEPNTIYYVRVKAVNDINQSDPSEPKEIETKNEEWINENIAIPTLNYKVTNRKGTNYKSKKIFIKFDENEMKKIENNKFNQKYKIQIGFNNDDEKTKAKFKCVADINTKKLIYDLNLNNKNIKKENILIRFQRVSNASKRVTEPKIFKLKKIFKPDAPKFKIDKNKIYPNCFELELPDCDYNFTYFIEFNKDENEPNDWEQIGTINPNKRTKKYRCKPLLEPNTKYYVRVKANINSNTSDPSTVYSFKTKDQKWIDKNLIIPTLNYKVTNYKSKKIFIGFDENEIKKIKNNNKFDEKYKIQIGFNSNSDDEKTMTECKFEDLEIINTNKLIYIYNLNNKNIKNENILIRFQCINNINYTQFTEPKKFTLLQILIKQAFQQQIGKYLKIVNHNFNKIENIGDYDHSIALFGHPITNNMCNKYDIYVKISKPGDSLGYVTNKYSIKNWNGDLKSDVNRKESVSMWIGNDGDEWRLNDKDNKSKRVQLKCKYNHSTQIIILSFNFIENQLEYYIENKNYLATKISLNHKKSIIPAFSSYDPADTIEIVKWELH